MVQVRNGHCVQCKVIFCFKEKLIDKFEPCSANWADLKAAQNCVLGLFSPIPKFVLLSFEVTFEYEYDGLKQRKATKKKEREARTKELALKKTQLR